MLTASVQSGLNSLRGRPSDSSLDDLSAPQRFLISALTGFHAMALADSQFCAEETRFRDTLLLPALGATDEASTNLVDVMSFVDEHVHEWQGVLQTLAGPLPKGAREALLQILVRAMEVDQERNPLEEEVLRTAAAALGVNSPLTGAVRIEPSELDCLGLKLKKSVWNLLRGSSPTTIAEEGPENDAHSGPMGDPTALVESLRPYQQDLAQLKATADATAATVRSSIAELGTSDTEAAHLALVGSLNMQLDDLEAYAAELSPSRASGALRVLVLGEFSRGKSTFLNALAGDEDLVPTDVLPCSATICRLRYGPELRFLRTDGDGDVALDRPEFERLARLSEEEAENPGTVGRERPDLIIEAPLEVLRCGVELVDSPGLNEDAGRTAATRHAMAKADAVLMLLHASQPLTHSEKHLLQEVVAARTSEPRSSESVFLLVNHGDLLRSPQDHEKVLKRVRNGVGPLLSGSDRLWLISAREALTRRSEPGDAWTRAFQEMTASLGQFLRTGPARGRLENKRCELRTALDRSVRLLSQLATEVSLRHGGSAEAISKAHERLAGLEKATARIEEIFEANLEKIGNAVGEATFNELVSIEDGLLEAAESWTSDNDPLWSASALAKDFQAQAKEYFLGRMLEFQNSVLTPIVAEHMEQLCEELREHVEHIQHLLETTAQESASGDQQESDDTWGVLGDLPALDKLARVLRFGPTAENQGWGALVPLGLAGGGFIFLIEGLAVVFFFPLALLAGLVGGIFLGLRSESRKIEIALSVAERTAEKISEERDQLIEQILDRLGEDLVSWFGEITQDLERLQAQTSRDIEVLEHAAGLEAAERQRIVNLLQATKANLSDKLQKLTV